MNLLLLGAPVASLVGKAGRGGRDWERRREADQHTVRKTGSWTDRQTDRRYMYINGDVCTYNSYSRISIRTNTYIHTCTLRICMRLEKGNYS